MLSGSGQKMFIQLLEKLMHQKVHDPYLTEKKKRYYFGKSFAGFVKNYGSEWRM